MDTLFEIGTNLEEQVMYLQQIDTVLESARKWLETNKSIRPETALERNMLIIENKALNLVCLANDQLLVIASKLDKLAVDTYTLSRKYEPD